MDEQLITLKLRLINKMSVNVSFIIYTGQRFSSLFRVNMKMNKQYYFSFFSLICFCSVLLSCQSSMTPLQVSEKFWLGIQQNNFALVKKYSLSDSVNESDDIDQFTDVTAITFGKIIIDADFAEIETSVTISSDDQIMDIPLKTYLKNENDVWKVNYEQTVLPLMINQEMTELFGGIQELTEEFAEEIEGSVEEFKEKAIPEIKSKLEQAEQELREKLPELKNMIDEFLKELEKSIEEAIPPKEEAKTQQT
jgi:hypothetical protein